MMTMKNYNMFWYRNIRGSKSLKKRQYERNEYLKTFLSRSEPEDQRMLNLKKKSIYNLFEEKLHFEERQLTLHF